VALVDPIDPASVDLSFDLPVFDPLWAQFFSDADGLDTPDLIAASAIAIGDLSSVFNPIDIPLGLASASLDAEVNLAPDPEFTKSETNSAQIDDALVSLAKFAPREAFEPIPQDLLPPPDLGGFNASGGSGTQPTQPTQPAGPHGPGSPIPGNGGAGGQNPPTYLHPEVEVRNLTRIGATDFKTGEAFSLQVLGRPNVEVSVSTTHVGVISPVTAVGVTDDTGSYYLTGTFKTADGGEWYESWYVGGILCDPVLHFFVN
jgi:hypothetical protein